MLNLSPRHFLEDVDDKELWLVGFIFTDLRGSNCVVRIYKPLVEVKVASDFYSGLCSSQGEEVVFTLGKQQRDSNQTPVLTVHLNIKTKRR
jgi:hypothetical protein